MTNPTLRSRNGCQRLHAEPPADVDLVAGVCHDLRGPLASFQALIEALEDGVLPESELPEHLGRLRLLAQRLLGMADDLAELERPQPSLVAVSLDSVVSDVVSVAAPTAAECAVRLRRQSSGEPVVTASRAWLVRALDNVVGNAIRHAAGGGEVTVTCTAAGDVGTVTVSDTGPGLPPGDPERLFEPYAQGPDGGAAGLGLAIVRSLVLAQGGAVSLTDGDSGCRVEIRLPLHA